MSLELLKQLKDKMKHNHRLVNKCIIENGVVEDTRDFFYQDGYPVEKGNSLSHSY